MKKIYVEVRRGEENVRSREKGESGMLFSKGAGSGESSGTQDERPKKFAGD